MSNVIMRCAALTKTFQDGTLDSVTVLKSIDLEISQGERVAIVGTSGSGKSTLLQCLAGLDASTSGQVTFMSHNMAALSERDRSVLRNQHMGFVYQFHHLLPEFTALENVAMPLIIRAGVRRSAFAAAKAGLLAVGLGERLHHKPSELSGGERQRTALARATVGQPACLLADEPTGNLDRKTAQQICQLLIHTSEQHRISCIIVTHDTTLAEQMDKTYCLEDGVLFQTR